MPKILVVDDEPQILTSTASLLDAFGYAAITTSNHRDVLPLLRRERPDVLLQDVRMPGLDVASLLQTIRDDALVADTPVILFSASLELFDIKDEVGAAECLEKPFRPSDLFAAIGRVAHGKSAELAHLAR